MASRTSWTLNIGYAKNKELRITQNDAPLGLVNWDQHACRDMFVRSHSGVPRDPHLERHKLSERQQASTAATGIEWLPLSKWPYPNAAYAGEYSSPRTKTIAEVSYSQLAMRTFGQHPSSASRLVARCYRLCILGSAHSSCMRVDRWSVEVLY